MTQVICVWREAYTHAGNSEIATPFALDGY